MGAHQQRRFWRLCRLYFRGFRMFIWLLILAALSVLIYINQVGLPDLIKNPLLEKLRARGLDLRFSRLRLSWNQGIVAENVHFGPADRQLSPDLNVAEVQVRLNWEALAHLRFQVDSLMLRQGRLAWALLETNPVPRELSVSGIQTDLRFLPQDQWALDNFRAQFAGANIQLFGVVTNASAVRDWKIFHGQEPASGSALLWQARLQRLADELERIRFAQAPEVRVNVRGDALDLHTFNVLLSISAAGAETPWGTLSQGRFAARLFAIDTNGYSHAELDAHAQQAKTPWASISNLALDMDLSSVDTQTNLVNARLKLSAGEVQTRWTSASNALLTASWVHSITNPIPVSGQGTFLCGFAQTAWAKATGIELTGSLSRLPESLSVLQQSDWSWWTNLAPYQVSWACRVRQLDSARVAANQVACAGSWLAPQLTVTNLDAALFDGQVAGSANLDVETRALHLNLDSNLDPHALARSLTNAAQSFLAQLSWPKPPLLSADISLHLPAWTNATPNWTTEVLPSVQMTGRFDFPQGCAYRQMQATGLRSHFIYTNRSWYLPDLTLERTEGRLEAEHYGNGITKDFYCRISSNIDPLFLEPLLGDSAKPAFDLFSLSAPPLLNLEIRGRFDELDSLSAQGRVALSNFTFRGQAISAVQTRVQYTNHLVTFLSPRVDVGPRYAKADALAVDLDAQLIYLTNGVSTADPMMIATVIGPQIVQAIEAYLFDTPPDARVYGIIPLHGEEGADLHFDLKGGPFHWWKFNLPHITGHVHWSGLHLSLTNVQADFYHGIAQGWAAFDFPRNAPTEFQFGLSSSNVLFHALMNDLSTGTNHLEGRLSANLAVTKANTDTWQSVFGYGDAHLRDGLLWDIPFFGIFSPILNGIAPGLGNSRASAATASFTINNGVIHTSDLEIRSTAMHLLYRGTVNLEGQTSARVDAELLRDMWLVGPLVSTMFWPVTKVFEYKVSGNLSDPKTEPVFIIPRMLLMPFHPFRTLKGLKPEDPNTSPNFSPLPP